MSSINFGFSAVNEPEKPEAKRTVIVFGVPRSGTTMTSKLLRALGVDMGKADNAVAEDIELANILEKNYSEVKLKEYINARDSQSHIWGWKRPESFRYRKRFIQHLTNPYYIFLFRDPLAIALRENISMNEPLLPRMTHVLKRYENIVSFVENTDRPCLLISYEKAVQSPTDLIEKVIDFIKITPSKAQIENAKQIIKPNDQEYIVSTKKKQQRLKGAVEFLSCDRISGWATYIRGNKTPELECRVGDELITTFSPDIHRPDLLGKQSSDIPIGFDVMLTQPISEEQLGSITVVDAKLGSTLRIKPRAKS